MILRFGALDHLVGGHRLLVGVAEDVVAGTDQVADQRFVANDLTVILGVGRGRRGLP